MNDELAKAFVTYSADKLTQLAGRIDDCLGRLSEEQVWTRGTENENAIGNLTLHLCGNVTQWIGSGVAGRTDKRDRDSEFAARGSASVAELRMRLRATIDDVAAIVRALSAEDLARRTSVQKYNLTVLEAVYHVVEHFAGHAGQILFATKLFTGEDLGYYKHLRGQPHTEKTP